MKTWFAKSGVEELKWPEQCLDSNPTENHWEKQECCLSVWPPLT